MINKKMLLSILIIGTVAVAAGAGTWASFSDAKTSEDNTFTAGNLVISLSDAFSIPAAAPGTIFPVQTITLSNSGSVPVSKVTAVLTSVDSVSTTGISNHITVTSVTFNDVAMTPDGVTLPCKLSALNGKTLTSSDTSGAIAAAGTGNFKLSCTFDLDAPNGCQDGVTTTDILFTASQ